jgi:phospholipid/cholesterol/gamma-HCH transport system permease protein
VPGVEIELSGARAEVERMLELYRGKITPHVEPEPKSLFEDIGIGTVAFGHRTVEVFVFAGQLVVSLLAAIRKPRTVHWRDLGRLVERAGTDSIPITTLINFLVGLIMGYQAALQLQKFGANIFLADLVGLSTTRELGPLMTAIIVAGRSGAAYAAELGTMRVRQEIDALQTLALDPPRFLVFPRITALVIVMPLLTLIADFVGILGGLVVGIALLDLTMHGYLNEMQVNVGLWDVFGGLIKSVVFGIAIALIACQQGLGTRGGADAVGRATTTAVVIILFALVVIDAVFAVLYNLIGI